MFVAQYIVGIQLTLATKDYNRSEPLPVFLNLFEVNMGTGTLQKVTVVLGTGTKIGTDDCNRLLSGVLYAPLYWNMQKQQLREDITKFLEYQDHLGSPVINYITDEYGAQQLLIHLLVMREATCRYEKVDRIYCTINKKHYWIWERNNYQQSVESILVDINAVPTKYPRLFLTVMEWKPSIVEQITPKWQRINRFAYQIAN
jgi:hypothetical protein